jgi:hypothetical protein
MQLSKTESEGTTRGVEQDIQPRIHARANKTIRIHSRLFRVHSRLVRRLYEGYEGVCLGYPMSSLKFSRYSRTATMN